MKIIGGMSMPHSISILSDDFVATATYRRSHNAIDCVVARRTPIIPLLARYRWIPIPRVLRLLIFLFSSSPILMGFLVGYQVVDRIVSGPTPTLPPIPFEQRFLICAFIQSHFIPLLAAILLFIKMFIGSWHAAEHMAISAYERLTSTEFADIASQDRVHPKCGGRLMAPLLIASFLVFCFGPINHLLLSQLVLIECILWIDHFVGFDKIPIFRTLSTLLQRYATTSPAGDVEILTAQTAVRALIAAHNTRDAQDAISPAP